MSSTNFPVEATAFLGAVAAFVVLLIVFFLYLNKKWCFYGVGGLSCCEEVLGSKPKRSKELGKAFSFSEPETSSDSDEEVLRRLQQSSSLHSTAEMRLPEPVPGPGPSHGSSGALAEAAFYHRQMLHTQAHVQPPPRPTKPRPGADLISLAEKGKAGGGSSSESSSCSTTSGEDEQQALRHREARYRKLQASAHAQCSIDTMDEETPLSGPVDMQSNNQDVSDNAAYGSV